MKLKVYREDKDYLLIVDGREDQSPVVVGFSRKDEQGEIIDEPARWLLWPLGMIWWVSDESSINQNDREIIFSVYRNDSLAERLFTTGWCIPENYPNPNQLLLGSLTSKSPSCKRWREEWRQSDTRMRAFRDWVWKPLDGWQNNAQERCSSNGSGLLLIDMVPMKNSVVFGLEVVAPDKYFPLVIGCSLQTEEGIQDIPAHSIEKEGLIRWELNISNGFVHFIDWNKKSDSRIIFALYKDADFKERLADTGWINYRCNARFIMNMKNDVKEPWTEFARPYSEKYLEIKYAKAIVFSELKTREY